MCTIMVPRMRLCALSIPPRYRTKPPSRRPDIVIQTLNSSFPLFLSSSSGHRGGFPSLHILCCPAVDPSFKCQNGGWAYPLGCRSAGSFWRSIPIHQDARPSTSEIYVYLGGSVSAESISGGVTDRTRIAMCRRLQ